MNAYVFGLYTTCGIDGIEPSVNDAMLESILESKEWTLDDSGRIIESSLLAQNNLKRTLSGLPKHETDNFLKESLMKFIKALKSS